MSEVAEYYADQLKVSPEDVEGAVGPVSIMPKIAEDEELHVHTLKHVDAAPRRLEIGQAALPHLSKVAGLVRESIQRDQPGQWDDYTRGKGLSAREPLAITNGVMAKLFPDNGKIKTGKIEAITMELIRPEDVPTSAINRLAAEAGRKTAAPGINPKYDTVHRIIARVRTGGYVGHVAAAALMQPTETTTNHGYKIVPAIGTRLLYAPYPKDANTAALLRDASAANAQRLLVAQQLAATSSPRYS